MIKVLILKSWSFPPIFRQTPNGNGIWNGIQFTTDLNSDYDYVLSLDSSPENISLHAYRENIWKINQEPPNEFFKSAHKAPEVFCRVFTTDPDLRGGRFINSQPAIPWFIDKSYDELKKCSIPKKNNDMSCITSLKSGFIGHKKRLDFINRIKKSIPLDLISSFDYYFRATPRLSFQQFKYNQLKLGFNKAVKNKLAALSPYRYSLIIENYEGPDYWSEKLADCFLTWTMPIYYGCTNINDYFPENSLVTINIKKEDAVAKIREIVNSNLWQKNQSAINRARNLILEKYQFFPYFAGKIKKWEIKYKNKKRIKQDLNIPAEKTFFSDFKMGLNSRVTKIKNIVTFQH